MENKDNSYFNFEQMTDEEIVLIAQGGCQTAFEHLLLKYKNLVRTKARTYFLVGADHEDIVQEGMIGLFKAIRDYKSDRQSSFKCFADLCITRQILTAIKTATRQKHLPLNEYVSLDKPIYDEESEKTLMDTIKEEHLLNPESMIISREDMDSMRDKLSSILSKLELDVLYKYIEGKSYQEISNETGHHTKAIDNALQRVKKKLQKIL